jgi:hypothetical protein
MVTGLGRCKYHETGTFVALEQWKAAATITAPTGATVRISSVGGVLNPTGVSAIDKSVKTKESIAGGTGQFTRAHGATSTTGQTVISPQGLQTYTFRFSGSITYST